MENMENVENMENMENMEKKSNIILGEISKTNYFPKIFDLVRIRFCLSFFDSSSASWRTRLGNSSGISAFANLIYEGGY